MKANETAQPATQRERVQAAQRGDADAFASLVAEHEAPLRRYCVRLLGQKTLAEDLAQETLLRAFEALPRLEDPDRFGAWLFGIATNLARVTWRRRDRIPVSLDHLLSADTSSGLGNTAGQAWAATQAATPEHTYELADQARRLLDAIEALPPQHRHTVVLHYIEDFSYAEVAAAMRVPVTTVKGWLHKSRTRLRRTIAPETASTTPATSLPSTRRGSGKAQSKDQPDQPKEHSIMASTPQPTGPPPLAGPAAAAQEGQNTASAWWERLPTLSPVLFGESAVAALREAEAEARRWQHNYVGTEHLLLAILRDGAGTPATVLTEFGASPEAVRTVLERRVGRGTAPAPAQINAAPRLRLALELAREDMRFLKHEQITTDHILLGLIQVPQGVAALLLEAMGLSVPQVRARVLSAIPVEEGSPRLYWRNAANAGRSD